MKLPFRADIGLLILRLGVGLLMAHHGYDKLLTLLGGGKISFPDPLGIGDVPSLVCTVFAEFVCSILLTFGLFTRWALIPLIICMMVIVTVLDPNASLDDREHALLFLVPYLTLWFTGPGRYSIDAVIFKK